MRWHDGGSLRLGCELAARARVAGAVRLTAGSLYFDSVAARGGRYVAPALAVQTPAGEVVHIGTQFMVTVAGDEVVLSVREGQVKVTGDGFELVVDANEELDLRADGTREVTAIDGYGERWAWAAECRSADRARRPHDVRRRRVGRARDRPARRLRDVDGPNASPRRTCCAASTAQPGGILTLLPDLTGLAYEIRDDTIVVSEP